MLHFIIVFNEGSVTKKTTIDGGESRADILLRDSNYKKKKKKYSKICPGVSDDETIATLTEG